MWTESISGPSFPIKCYHGQLAKFHVDSSYGLDARRVKLSEQKESERNIPSCSMNDESVLK